ncbi:MAG: FKBP-type peptidyl-prolyl cis-trans isomerase [Cytophagales bacterium]|nr:MAG: FKBP-type peptidyl-prolyl cis-trans isomerase [Cytophagales bacterium]
MALLFTSCGGDSNTANSQKAPTDAQTTPSGVKYIFHQKNDKGKKAAEGMYATFHFVMKNSEDSVLRSTYTEITGPMKQLRLEKPKVPGTVDEVLMLMSEGDSVTVWINIDSLAKKTNMQRPHFIKAGSDIRYTIKMLKIQNEEEIKKENEALLKVQKEEDEKKIKDFLSKNPKYNAAKVTPTGLYYLIESEGKGKMPIKGDTVELHYTGKLTDNKEFDSSKGKTPFEFVLGMGMVIAGWDEGVALLKEGTKATFIIPSHLGYGKAGAGDVIPPDAILVFDVELLKIKKAK